MTIRTLVGKSVAVTLAAVALGVGVFVSSSAMADKAGRCDKTTACNDEISDACGPQPSMSCAKNITDQCKAFLCTCTGEPGLPVCGAIECCVQSSPMGAFDTCTEETPAECAAQGGIALGSGTCSPNPCPPITTTTTTTTTTTLGIQCCVRTITCGAFDTCQVLQPGQPCNGISLPGNCTGPAPCAHATTTTPPSACCTQSTPGGPFDQCSIQGLCECQDLLHGRFLLFQFCTPNPCETTTTSSTTSTTTTSTSTSTTTTTT
jgi:hypothetical protein